MTCYCVWLKNGSPEDRYWVRARSANDARRLVALNTKADAENVETWACAVSEEHVPPDGVILTGGGKTFAVKKQ